MDVLTPEQRRKNMQAIKNKNTKIEKLLAKYLTHQGIRYIRDNRNIFGKPDFTLKRQKIAIFCDSEYFHGKDWQLNKKRIKTNIDFWCKKIENNIARDKLVNRTLLKDGWKVIRFWGDVIKKNPEYCIARINNQIDSLTVKYSKIRQKLNVLPEKETDNGLANFTHYLHNSNNRASKYFKKSARKYLLENQDRLDLAAESDFQYFLPIKWDIPFPAPEKFKFKFIDLFAGIGGVRLAYQKQGGKCVFTSEWDKFAKKTYEANFGEVPFGDITKINEAEIPEHDLLLAGFPCQPFSIAGVSKKNSLGRKHGFLDETQGTLFFDVARIIKQKKPKAFMLENVKNLISHDKGRTFNIIFNTLVELGYSIHYQILDGKHFVPQHRERIIIVGFNNDFYEGNEDFSFPNLPEPTMKFFEILESKPDDKYTLSNKLWVYLQNYAQKHKAKGNGFGFGMTELNGIARTLSARYYKDGSEILIPQKGKNPRRLTPRECARLMGYPDKYIIPVSDNQAYRQFGNSVIVPLIESIANAIVKAL
jgi:DNA (cytosine-5)-methyltransferase 1